MIISFMNSKGGTSKSTLAWCIAHSKTIQDKFSLVGLIDLDVQNTLSNWWKARQEHGLDTTSIEFINMTVLNEASFVSQFNAMQERSDLIILDCPGESSNLVSTRFAAEISDLIIIPMRTSTSDENAFEYVLLPLIESIIDHNKDSLFYIIPTFIHPRSNPGFVIDYIQKITPDYVCCLNTVMFNRSIFENFTRNGRNLLEYAETVKNNRASYTPALKAIEDIEKISKALST